MIFFSGPEQFSRYVNALGPAVDVVSSNIDVSRDVGRARENYGDGDRRWKSTQIAAREKEKKKKKKKQKKQCHYHQKKNWHKNWLLLQH